MRSQIFRQIVSKLRRQADACQEIWVLYGGKYASKMCADYLRIGSKSEKDNLTKAERNELKKLVEILANELDRKS